jgi:hypothetical protein
MDIEAFKKNEEICFNEWQDEGGQDISASRTCMYISHYIIAFHNALLRMKLYNPERYFSELIEPIDERIMLMYKTHGKALNYVKDKTKGVFIDIIKWREEIPYIYQDKIDQLEEDRKLEMVKYKFKRKRDLKDIRKYCKTVMKKEARKKRVEERKIEREFNDLQIKLHKWYKTGIDSFDCIFNNHSFKELDVIKKHEESFYLMLKHLPCRLTLNSITRQVPLSSYYVDFRIKDVLIEVLEAHHKSAFRADHERIITIKNSLSHRSTIKHLIHVPYNYKKNAFMVIANLLEYGETNDSIYYINLREDSESKIKQKMKTIYDLI